MEKRKFKIKNVEIGSFYTSFSISDLGHPNKQNVMSSEAFVHHIGSLFGKKLEKLKGLEFEILIPVGAKEDKVLNLCGKRLGNGK